MRGLPRIVRWAGIAVLLAGCGAVPAMPGEVPDDLVPQLEAPHVADPGALSELGVDVAERMAIRVRNVGCGELSTGSGFAIDERTIVTNRHVVAEADRLQVTTSDGREIDAVSASITDVADLALLRTQEPVTSVPGLAAEDAAVGEEVTVVGYPMGGRLTTSSGTVLGYEQDPLGSDLGLVGRTNAEVDQGSSGSAVLNSDGEVVGVVYAMDMWRNSYVVPVTTLQDLLADDVFEPITSCRDEEGSPAGPQEEPPSWDGPTPGPDGTG